MPVHEHLPLLRSSKETVANWPQLSTAQRLGAAAAGIITTTRPILRGLQEFYRGNNKEPTPAEFATSIALDLSDKVDGVVARSADAVTPLGKELDPFMDKVDFAIQETAQLQRGTLPLGHVAVRLARDVAITLLRSHVHAATHGEADIGAGWHGKASTFARLASLRATGLPIERDHPRLRTFHQTIATTAVVASGIENARNLLAAKKKYINRRSES